MVSFHPVQRTRVGMRAASLRRTADFMRSVLVALECAAIAENAVAADVRGHGHDGVPEVHGSPLPICQPAVVEDLQPGR